MLARFVPMLLRILIPILFGSLGLAHGKGCVRRDYHDINYKTAFGCVCNATFCDQIEPLGEIQDGNFVVYLTTRERNRLDRVDFHFTSFPNVSDIITVDTSRKYQQIMGFGGAITDSVGINLLSLSQTNRDNIMKAYYSQEGIQYRFTRIPMASCDFSTYTYSFDDVEGDMDLVHFNLTKEDYTLKLPFIRQARQLVESYGADLKLYTTAWSAPAWMKQTGRMTGGGELKGERQGEYYKTWANYYKRFFEEYHKEGIDFWALTPGNEPTAGADVNYKWQALYFDAEMQRDFIKMHLGPALRSSNITKDIKIMIGDDQRYVWPSWAETVLSDEDAAQYVSGLAFHWYEDFIVPASVVQETYDLYPDHFMLYTEACAGYLPWEGTPRLGDWSRGDLYAFDILTNLKHGVRGWVDWNIALDPTGGPNYARNDVDAPIIVNATADEFIKQPMFYALGHFSKFVHPGYTRVEIDIPGGNEEMEGIAFVSPDGKQRVLVLMNRNEDKTLDYSIQDHSNPKKFANVHLEPKSILTVIYNM